MRNSKLYFSLVTCTAVLMCSRIFAQPLPADTLWTKSLGGSGAEASGQATLNNLGMNAAYAAVDAAGNFYATTYTLSNDGYVGGNAGQEDVWVVKLSAQGDTLWTKRFGGSGNERVYRIRAVSAGGVVMVGVTQSNDGDFVGSKGQTDAFIIQLDVDGNIVFKKLYGGSEQDYLYDIVENPAGSFVACGESSSINGDLVSVGSGLAWVLFINGTTGAVANSKTFTGPDHSNPDFLENFTTITRLSDGSGYLASGFSTPEFNDFNKDNIWVQKFNSSGATVWSKKYGSVAAGDYSATLLDVGAGTFYIIGSTSAAGGDNTSGYYGGPSDGWLIKCDASGNIMWNKHYGGSDWDGFYDAVIQPSGNLLISGFTRSSNNDLALTAPYGLTDYWLLQLTDTGGVVNMRRVGGSQADVGIGMAYDSVHNRVMMVGRSESNDGYVQGNKGGRDMWVVCFGDQVINSINESSSMKSLHIYPNPCHDELFVDGVIAPEQIRVYDIAGKEVINISPPISTPYRVDISELNPGMYYVKTTGEAADIVQPLIKTE